MRNLLDIVGLLAEAKIQDTHMARVWVNPVYGEMLAIMRRMPEMRGIATPTDLFVWDAAKATHFDMVGVIENQLGYDLSHKAHFIFVSPDGNWSNTDWWPDPDAEPVEGIGYKARPTEAYGWTPVRLALGFK